MVLTAILRVLLSGDELEPTRVLEVAHWLGLLAAIGGLWALLRGALVRVSAAIALRGTLSRCVNELKAA